MIQEINNDKYIIRKKIILLELACETGNENSGRNNDKNGDGGECEAAKAKK